MVLVFDLGGTKTRIALAENGALKDVVRIPTDRTTMGFAKFLGHLQEVAANQHLSAVAGGFPGQLKGLSGEIEIATNLPEWLGLPMVARIRELFDCPVAVTNDVEMCGLGEAHFGAGSTDGVMAYYTVSTGVNAVRLVNGKIDPTIGRYELGKQIADHVGKRPVSLEALISGAALERRLGEAPREIEDKTVWDVAEGLLASAIYNTILYWNPGLVVFGGSMMRDIPTTKVKERLEQMPAMYGTWPKLALAKLGDESGLYGAVAYLEEQGYR